MNKLPELSLECTSISDDFLKVTGESDSMYISAEEMSGMAGVLLSKDDVIKLRDYCTLWLGDDVVK